MTSEDLQPTFRLFYTASVSFSELKTSVIMNWERMTSTFFCVPRNETSHTLLKIKYQKGGFCSDAIKQQFWVPKEPISF